MKIKLLIVIVLTMPHFLFSQSAAQFVKAGDKKFGEGDYYAASLYYTSALKKDKESAALQYKFAESARMFNDYKVAAEAYAEVAASDQESAFPLASFWQGVMLKSSGKYDEAIKQFKLFRGKYRKKDYYILKAQQEIESCLWAKDHLKPNEQINIEHLGKEVNTGASEFNAIHVFPDKLQFSAIRNISTDKKHEKYLARIYNQPPSPESIFLPAGANEEQNIGNGNYSSDTKRFYFTQCEQKDKTTTRCDIYVSRYENYKWSAAEKLSDHVNDPKFTNTHPAPGYDLSGNEILFFASDREGGQGNMDIWTSKLNADGTYQTAVNVGNKINTPGNEVTPFYELNEKRLYFSSDWHYGFGGFDIFESTGESVNWTEPKNLLTPINTPQNDLYYSVASDLSKSYITSNRVGSYFIEAETCCNDIYAFATDKKIKRVVDIPVGEIKKDIVLHQVDSPTIPITILPSFRIDDKVKNIQQQLPVTLYFHNDEPDCCNLRDTTSLDYKQTYEAYTALLNEYKKEFAGNLKKDEKEKAGEEILNLFMKKVDKGYYDLVSFSARLLELLQAGNKIEVTIKGYCSPLNDNAYNIHLGYRRIASLKNYFFHYREAMLIPFLKNGSLTLKNESFGEETAAKGISDSRTDTRNSVYNPAAALERKVEIISVELK
ncbi:MAG: PD40 domain-containing protein [Bacteroidetes bacterium]|nr:PD40 domain-containing protein [Bacteroidota bacterium]